MGKLMYNILFWFGEFLVRMGTSVRELALRLQFPLETIEVKPMTDEEVKEEIKDLFPHSFATFKEGMASGDYCTRHDAAAKLVGWYLHQDGHPFVEDLVRAAEIMLECGQGTSGDVSYLVGAWKDQASATNDKDREEAEQREQKIYDDLEDKLNKTQGDK